MSSFSDEDIKLAQKVQTTYGVPASVTLAQYALESAYGTKTSGVNNYFGIKGNGRNGYRDYDSKESSFMDYGAKLAGERYASKTNGSQNPLVYLKAVASAGYAEDSDYAKKAYNIVKNYNLTQYDVGGNVATWWNGTQAKNGDANSSYTNVSYATNSSGSSGGSDSSGSSGTSGGLGLEWWGDVVRVIIILLVVAAGFIFVATSVGQLGVDVPNVSDALKTLKGGK